MKYTRANVEQIAKDKGYEPVQIDGVVEGFSWREPDLTIGEVTHKGRLVIFHPLTDKITYDE